MPQNASVRWSFWRLRIPPLALATVIFVFAVVGLPPAIFHTTSSLPPGAATPASDEKPIGPLRALVASHSTLASVVYPQWLRGYLENGGDRNVVVGLGSRLGLSTEPSEARGSVALDLVGGSLTARVEGLGDQSADLWLIDDSDAPGLTSLPEPGDHMVRVGRLEQTDEGARVSAHLGAGFFGSFELDTVVVSRAGSTPAESRILLGTRPFFERVYTKSRLAAEASRPGALHASLESLLEPRPAFADSTQVLIAHGLVSQAVGNGADLFFRGTFNGNGRTCGTCHRVENNLVVEAAFIGTLPSTDKIFVAEFPSSQGGVPGLERPALMRGFGLILENVDGLENPTVKFVMRGVPHTLSVGTSVRPPADGRNAVERTGWSGDGAPDSGALRLFANGAVVQHFTKRLNRVVNVDFRLPTQTELDSIEAYLRSTGRTNELNLAGVSLSDPGAELGRRIFNNNNTDPTIGSGKCLNCHRNAGANLGNGTNGNFDTGVENVPHPARNTESFPFDGGFGTAARDCNGDAINDCFGDGTFNAPPLIEAADTPPFFHNNVARTVEDSVAFYSSPQFQASPSGAIVGGIALSAQETQNVAAFLRVINAAFNVDMAIQRNDAGIALENSAPLGTCSGGEPVLQSDLSPSGDSPGVDCAAGGDETGKRETINKLLSLSNEEAQDAIDVLNARSLHPDAVTLLQSAINKNNQAIATFASQQRKDLMQSARSDLSAARLRFGTGIGLTMGEGNLLF
ncbi:MAG TPA: hypothetical protein VGV60_10990 [Candidatus Polarisedimenticolia bacterium]|jgi:cytochrome c peroxidase|nr:hypothetical protein [Candidatus Polarisedimenticolia bacterium]